MFVMFRNGPVLLTNEPIYRKCADHLVWQRMVMFSSWGSSQTGPEPPRLLSLDLGEIGPPGSYLYVTHFAQLT